MAANDSIILFSGAATGNGTWFAADQFNIPVSILFEGTFAADSFTIMVKNDDVRPLDATDGVAYGAAVTAVGKVAITEAYRWIKAKKTAGTGAITVTLFSQLLPG